MSFLEKLKLIGYVDEGVVTSILEYVSTNIKYIRRIAELSTRMGVEINIPFLAYEEALLLGPLVPGSLASLVELVRSIDPRLELLAVVHMYPDGTSCPLDRDVIAGFKLRGGMGFHGSLDGILAYYEYAGDVDKLIEYKRCTSNHLKDYILTTGGLHSGPPELKVLQEISCKCIGKTGILRIIARWNL